MITLTETRERFLHAIATEILPTAIEEIHFFAPMKQNGIESGVAVIAANVETPLRRPSHETAESEPNPSASVEGEAEPPQPPARFAVYTARYRLVLKGLDRGKWETNVVAEADAPLVTVDAVVRGVKRRAGDVEEPERFSGDDIRELLAATAA